MKKVLSIIFLCFLFATGAQARLLYEDKEYAETQETTIKGFLYDIAYNGMPEDEAAVWRPQFARAIVWFERAMKSKKIYRLEKLAKKGKEATVIKDATDIVIKILKGEYPGISPKIALDTWVSYDKRVVAEYKKNGNTIHWKFELKP